MIACDRNETQSDLASGGQSCVGGRAGKETGQFQTLAIRYCVKRNLNNSEKAWLLMPLHQS